MKWDRMVWYLRYDLGLSKDDAEDAAARGMEIAWAKGRLDDPAFVNRCAHNVGRDIIKMNRRRASRVRDWTTINVPTVRHGGNAERHRGQLLPVEGVTDHLVAIPFVCAVCGGTETVSNGKGRRRCKTCSRARGVREHAKRKAA